MRRAVTGDPTASTKVSIESNYSTQSTESSIRIEIHHSGRDCASHRPRR